MNQKTWAWILSIAVLSAPIWAEKDETSTALTGFVSSNTTPLEKVTVYAYEIANLNILESQSDPKGRFTFSQLSTGLYKVIALKEGFLPSVMMLSRRQALAEQYLEFELIPETMGDTRTGETYWTTRDQVPADVLRRWETRKLTPFSSPGTQIPGQFKATVSASTGVDNRAGSAKTSTADINLESEVAGLNVNLAGSHWDLAPTARQSPLKGASSSVAINIQDEDNDSSLRVSGLKKEFVGQNGSEDGFGVNRYDVTWNHQSESGATTAVEAGYQDRRNQLQTQSSLQLNPEAATVWTLESSYTKSLGQRNSLQAGIRFEEARQEFSLGNETPYQDVEIFGYDQWQANKRVLVEFGFATRLTDGTLSLTPRGKVVVQLGDLWQAETEISAQMNQEQPAVTRIRSQPLIQNAECRSREEYCYRVVLSRENNQGHTISLGALDRKVGETLELYFNDEFLGELESLFLFEGDRIPEIQFSMSRHVTPHVLARLESNFGSGGGGLLYATDQTFTNSVRYLVTSLDTKIKPSSTGVFLAFHQLEQDLETTDLTQGLSSGRLEKLQLMLTQDLSTLLNMANQWALQLNMEWSKGQLPFQLESDTEDESRRRISGGLSVRF